MWTLCFLKTICKMDNFLKIVARVWDNKFLIGVTCFSRKQYCSSKVISTCCYLFTLFVQSLTVFKRLIILSELYKVAEVLLNPSTFSFALLAHKTTSFSRKERSSTKVTVVCCSLLPLFIQGFYFFKQG